MEQEKAGKAVNKKVLAMFDKAEAEAKELTDKRVIVLNDKNKIEAVISELDDKKKEALEATWKQVNKDFGSIFSTLLPGTTSKLDPPEGCTCLDGLEVGAPVAMLRLRRRRLVVAAREPRPRPTPQVKVAFGGVWKQSLTELSGGQRSLLALSLILALLLFKPAPIYILDEVDAALDLSHTQNIGRMIRSHFPQSQFIVVSLKEGMFNNANVIFRTKVLALCRLPRACPCFRHRSSEDTARLCSSWMVSPPSCAQCRPSRIRAPTMLWAARRRDPLPTTQPATNRAPLNLPPHPVPLAARTSGCPLDVDRPCSRARLTFRPRQSGEGQRRRTLPYQFRTP